MAPNIPGSGGVTHAFHVQPVLPIGPFKAFPIVQLIKMTIPFPVLPAPVNQAGMGDLQVFDLLSFNSPGADGGSGQRLFFLRRQTRRWVLDNGKRAPQWA